jgi:hypothetical protein
VSRQRGKHSRLVSVAALRRFRNECREQQLSLECAMATVAIQAMHLHQAVTDDSWLRTKACIGSLCDSIPSLLNALQLEYPDINWESSAGKRPPEPVAIIPSEPPS